MNNLNKRLQGEDKFVCDMIGHITAFEFKLKLFRMQLKAHYCVNFEKLQFLKQKFNLNNYDLFSTCTENFLFEFNSRFIEFRERKILFTLIADPWLVLPEELYQCQPYIKEEHIGEIQMELIDLQSNDVLKQQHQQANKLANFWKKTLQPQLKRIARIMLSMFGSTYNCERSFSVLGNIKNKQRNRLSNNHTSELVKAAVTNLEPEYGKIMSLVKPRFHIDTKELFD